MRTVPIMVALIEVESVTALGEAWFWESGLDPCVDIQCLGTRTWLTQS